MFWLRLSMFNSFLFCHETETATGAVSCLSWFALSLWTDYIAISVLSHFSYGRYGKFFGPVVSEDSSFYFSSSWAEARLTMSFSECKDWTEIVGFGCLYIKSVWWLPCLPSWLFLALLFRPESLKVTWNPSWTTPLSSLKSVIDESSSLKEEPLTWLSFSFCVLDLFRISLKVESSTDTVT